MVRISEETISKVKSVPVLSLAEQLGYIPKRVGKQFEILCPVCGAKNTFIEPSRDIFKCFGDSTIGACGCSGKGSISFYSHHEFQKKEGHYVESVRGVAKTMGITVKDHKGNVIDENDDVNVSYQEIKRYEEAPPADPDTLDKVYNAFLSLCPIAKPHAEEWMVKRGYSKLDIKTLGLRSVPPVGMAAKILVTLKKKGYPLERIPGFYQQFISFKMNYPEELMTRDEKNDGYWIWTINAKSGYFIPVRDEEGRIIRLRVRDKSYTWFSSTETHLTEKEKKYWKKGGASSGAVLNLVPPIELMHIWKGNSLEDICDVSTLIVTEGEHKSQISANILKKAVVGIPGVGLYDRMFPLLNKWRPKKLIIAYDSDSFYDPVKQKKNQQVFDHLVEFSNKTLDLGVEVCIWTWEPELGKGLDDMLLNKKSERVVEEINLSTHERKTLKFRKKVASA